MDSAKCNMPLGKNQLSALNFIDGAGGGVKESRLFGHLKRVMHTAVVGKTCTSLYKRGLCRYERTTGMTYLTDLGKAALEKESS